MELSKQVNAELYPEVAAARSLSNALDQALAAVGSPLHANAEVNFIPIARTAEGSRFCQMYMAAHERLFIVEFSAKGITYGRGSSISLNDAARAIHFWIIDQPNIAQMQARFSFFVADEQAIAQEASRLVEYQWGRLLKTWRVRTNPNLDAKSPLPLIEAAMKKPELAQLFPFTSMNSLHFSRTTGYPFTNDCPCAIPIGNNRFRAYGARLGQERMAKVIGDGTAEQVVAMLVAHLPPNCGPAVDGTADDLNEEQS